MSIDLGQLYAASRHRITDLVMSSPAHAQDTGCPATPGWSVHDVVAHLRGIAEDVRTGNLEGVATDPWTAAQVERHRSTATVDLLAQWADDAPLLESILSSPQGAAVGRAVVDVHAHEGDVRGGLGRPAPLPDEFATWAMPAITEQFFTAINAAGLPSVRIVTAEGDHLGQESAPISLGVSRVELLRAVLGRRSAAQVMSYDWGGADASPYLTHFFIFGPRDTDLVE